MTAATLARYAAAGCVFCVVNSLICALAEDFVVKVFELPEQHPVRHTIAAVGVLHVLGFGALLVALAYYGAWVIAGSPS